MHNNSKGVLHLSVHAQRVEENGGAIDTLTDRTDRRDTLGQKTKKMNAF